MNCDCINEINKKLEEHNLRLCGYAYAMPAFKPIITIETEWVDKDKVVPNPNKKWPTKMFASHCPFCGKEAGAKPHET